MEQSSPANPTVAQTTYDPFYASNTLAAASTFQMAAMASQQQMMMMMMNRQLQSLNLW